MTKPKLASYYSEKSGDGRLYKSPSTLNKYPSVTTVNKLVAKDFSQYAARKTAEWCAEHWMELGQKSTEKATNQAQYRWMDDRNERAEVGTGVHEAIELLHTFGWDYSESDFPNLDQEQHAIMTNWVELNSWYKIEPILSEFQCFNETVGYAGTADGLWRIDGKVYLIDIKTSKKVYDEHWYQLAALGNSPIYFEDLHPEKPAEGYVFESTDWLEKEVPDFAGYAIIHLRDDHSEIIYDTPSEMDLHWQAFQRYVGLYKISAELKEMRSDAKKELAAKTEVW